MAYLGENIVFIVGSPRSGTTWLQKLLGEHPSVRIGQESYVMQYPSAQLRQWHRALDPSRWSSAGGTGLGCYHTEESFLSVLREYTRHLLEPMVGELKTGGVFVDKTPSHALYSQDIHYLLPHAKVIHLLRDPRDVINSMLHASRTWGKVWAPNNIEAAARMWLRHVTAVHKAVELRSSNVFMELHFEELKKNTASQLSKVSDFCGLQWRDATLDLAIQKNEINKGSTKKREPRIGIGGEVAKMMGSKWFNEPEGFVRRGRVGSWRTEMSFMERRKLKRVLGKHMQELGYYW